MQSEKQFKKMSENKNNNSGAAQGGDTTEKKKVDPVNIASQGQAAEHAKKFPTFKKGDVCFVVADGNAFAEYSEGAARKYSRVRKQELFKVTL